MFLITKEDMFTLHYKKTYIQSIATKDMFILNETSYYYI